MYNTVQATSGYYEPSNYWQAMPFFDKKCTSLKPKHRYKIENTFSDL